VEAPGSTIAGSVCLLRCQSPAFRQEPSHPQCRLPLAVPPDSNSWESRVRQRRAHPTSRAARYNRSHLDKGRHPRRWTVIFSGLLCGVLALVVIYTSRGGLSSPLAIVVLAAIGLLALILQLRLREPRPVHAPLWLNLFGILFALAGLGSDLTHFHPELAPVLALVAVACFAVSAATMLQALRHEPPQANTSEQSPPE
jgi:drug/metabolite transporter (DMT)-like permease